MTWCFYLSALLDLGSAAILLPQLLFKKSLFLVLSLHCSISHSASILTIFPLLSGEGVTCSLLVVNPPTSAFTSFHFLFLPGSLPTSPYYSLVFLQLLPFYLVLDVNFSLALSVFKTKYLLTTFPLGLCSLSDGSEPCLLTFTFEASLQSP